MNKVKLVGEEKKEIEIKAGDLFRYKDFFYMLVVENRGETKEKYHLVNLHSGDLIQNWESLEDFVDYYGESDFIRLEEGESIQITPDLDR